MSRKSSSQQDADVETRRNGSNTLDEVLTDCGHIFVGDDMGDKQKENLRIISQNTGLWSPKKNLEKFHEHADELWEMNADVYLFQEIGINSHHPRMKNEIKKR